MHAQAGRIRSRGLVVELAGPEPREASLPFLVGKLPVDCVALRLWVLLEVLRYGGVNSVPQNFNLLFVEFDVARYCPSRL